MIDLQNSRVLISACMCVNEYTATWCAPWCEATPPAVEVTPLWYGCVPLIEVGAESASRDWAFSSRWINCAWRESSRSDILEAVFRAKGSTVKVLAESSRTELIIINDYFR